jgi:8-oxo-dGTP pyrophosphatase MutT (NUDIX family)
VILPSTRQCLEQYRPVDVREQDFQARMLGLLDSAEPWSRTQYRPGHLTASAFVLSPDGAAVLLIFHRKLGIWIQPGGHIEPADASLLAAAQREVAEEVGVALEAPAATSIFDVDIHAIPARKAEPEHEHFDVRFCFRASSLTFIASDEVLDTRWVELRHIDQVTADESVLRAVRKLRAYRAKA